MTKGVDRYRPERERRNRHKQPENRAKKAQHYCYSNYQAKALLPSRHQLLEELRSNHVCDDHQASDGEPEAERASEESRRHR